jgi:hypothetical protein
MPWDETFPVSDIDKGFATIIARHFNAQFDHFQNGYVANGHPSVETHRKIAGQMIEAIEAIYGADNSQTKTLK